MDKNVIAAQLYTLRDFTRTPADIENTLKKVKKIGYDAVQVSGMGPIDPVQLKDIADKAGLKIVATHISPDRLKNDFNALAKEHILWDCKYIGIGSMPPEYPRNKEGFKAFAKDFSKIARQCADRGLSFIYHNHKFEFEKFDGVTGMEILLNETDPEVFNFEVDTYWVQAGGGEPAEWIRKVKGRMDVVHFKDMAIKENSQVYAEIGEGNLNWGSILEACKDTGVKWYCVEQDVCLRDPFESLAISLQNMKKM
ncbi:MAG TPA: sugar phosphate isomerase/epimerase [Clostridiales bacterium]|nr:sugar phosphate isomerase/epimerase [Clostridiales bacterium]